MSSGVRIQVNNNYSHTIFVIFFSYFYCTTLFVRYVLHNSTHMASLILLVLFVFLALGEVTINFFGKEKCSKSEDALFSKKTSTNASSPCT